MNRALCADSRAATIPITLLVTETRETASGARLRRVAIEQMAEALWLMKIDRESLRAG
jgi:hypothetical protein